MCSLLDFNKRHVLFETPHAVVVAAGKPILPGHALVVPKEKCQAAIGVDGLSDEVYCDLYAAAQKFTAAMRAQGAANGFNLSLPAGVEARQRGHQPYLQIVSRKEGDVEGDAIYRMIDEYEPCLDEEGRHTAMLKRFFDD